MRCQAIFVSIIASLLLGCADENALVSNPESRDTSNFLDIETSYNAASKQNLGTFQDIEKIKRAIIKNDREKMISEQEIIDIRWTSATRAIVRVERNKNENLGYEAYYYILEKSAKGWDIVEHLDLIS